MTNRQVRVAVRALNHLDSLTTDKGVPLLDTAAKFRVVDMLAALEPLDAVLQKKIEHLTKKYAERDDKGDLIPDGNRGVKLHNPVAYEIEMSELMEQKVEGSVRCAVLSMEDLADVESHVHARHLVDLGPFLKKTERVYGDDEVLVIGEDV